MSRVIENYAFPSAMEVKLRRIRWRQIGLAIARAVAISVSVLIGSMLVAMLADWWFTIFNTTVRSALTFASLSISAAAFLMTAIQPVVRAPGWTRAARDADAEVPQLEERWTTISHFASSEHLPDTTTSQAMLQQVTSEAVALGVLVEPARVAPVARLRNAVIGVGTSAVVLVGLLAANWEQNSVLMRRFCAPTAPITATQIKSVTGDAVIPRGQAIDIVTTLSGLERHTATLTLVTEPDESREIVLAVDPDAPRRFAHIVDVEDSFRYRVRAGDGRTQWHSITAVDPPELSAVRLTVTAPEYVDRPAYEKSLLPGRVKAIQGSRLTLEMRSEAELARFELLMTRDNEAGKQVAQTLTLTAQPNGWYRFEMLLEQDLSISPTLHSPYGLTNKDRRVCRIRVIPDRAPVARVISPTEEMAVSADEEIDIKFEAHDDHGIVKAELIVYKDTENGKQEVLSVKEIPLGDQQLKNHVMGNAKLDLSAFDLDEGANISYAVRVTDNRMLKLNPDDVASRKRGGDESRDGESERVEGENDATSLAHSSDLAASAENLRAPKATEIARTDENSDLEARDGDTPDKTQVANVDAAAGLQQPRENSTNKEIASNAQENSREDSGRAASVAESGKEGLHVGAATHEPGETVAQANVEGERSMGEKTETTNPDRPIEVAAGEDNAPARNEVPGSTDGNVATVKSDSPSATGSDSRSPDDASRSLADTNPRLAQTDNASPQNPREKVPVQGSSGQSPGSQQRDPDSRSKSGSIRPSELPRGSSPSALPPPDLERNMRFETQLGQNTESNRLRLRIMDRLAVAAEAGESRRSDTMNTRELLKAIDHELEAAEAALVVLNEQPELDAMPDKIQQVDARLEKAELLVADLRRNSKGTKYEFVGLQLVDIGRTHVTPARDRMFVLIQDPGSNPARNVLEALHRTSAARELIAALTKRFEEVARERELADSLAEIAKVYEVYVENARGVLRELQKNQNPLRRKMAVIEVDEAYLDRYAQVLEMRREMMAEFARILSDDPRLTGKYMDIIKRRDGNLRNRLTHLRELQEEISHEVSGWLRVGDAQRPDVWIQVSEMRLLAVKDLVKAASQLESRTLSQLPLNLEPDTGIGAQVVEHSKEVALMARRSSLQAKRLMNSALEGDESKVDLVELADELKHKLSELDAVLEQLAFEREGEEEIGDFTNRRLAESRGVTELVNAWAEVTSQVLHDRFHGLARVDQQRLAVDTDRLRLDMSGIEGDLGGLFRPDDVPAEVTNIVRELVIVMETITFNQVAATYELNNGNLDAAESQQTMANDGFARAEELFDMMRRTTAGILDEREVNNPNIADLQDPTLDEFLERLEREPNLNQLLGIPNRPRNLRVIRDWMLWQAQGSGEGGGSAQQAAANAMNRAQIAARRRSNEDDKRRQASRDGDLTEEEMQEFANAEILEEEMQEMLRAIEKKMKDPASGEEQRKQLQQQAEMLSQMLEEARRGSLNREKWEELARADEMRAMMEALAGGEPIPDSQWNRLLSTLDTGLWQIRGRTPPEDYRKAIEQYQDQIRRLLNAESIED